MFPMYQTDPAAKQQSREAHKALKSRMIDFQINAQAINRFTECAQRDNNKSAPAIVSESL